MDPVLVLIQGLNGLQLGVMLFLMAAGLTLVFGIMNLINLAHGSLYMMGAYLAATLQQHTGSFLLAVMLALPAVVLIGMLVELIALRTLYGRDHLDQVLATFGTEVANTVREVVTAAVFETKSVGVTAVRAGALCAGSNPRTVEQAIRHAIANLSGVSETDGVKASPN